MKPTKQEVQDRVVFLGLGVDKERYLAPYYSKLPSIACLDYDQEQRLFLKNLKYETREMYFLTLRNACCFSALHTDVLVSVA